MYLAGLAGAQKPLIPHHSSTHPRGYALVFGHATATSCFLFTPPCEDTVTIEQRVRDLATLCSMSEAYNNSVSESDSVHGREWPVNEDHVWRCSKEPYVLCAASQYQFAHHEQENSQQNYTV